MTYFQDKYYDFAIVYFANYSAIPDTVSPLAFVICRQRFPEYTRIFTAVQTLFNPIKKHGSRKFVQALQIL